MEVDGEMATLKRQIERVEIDIEKVEIDIEKVENAIQGGDLTPEDKQYWREKENKLREKENKLREEKLLYLKSENDGDPRSKRPKSEGQDVRSFWINLGKAIKGTHVVDMRVELVTTAVRVAAVTLPETQVYQRRNRKLSVEATTLSLEPGTFFPNTQMSQIMIREVYDKFADIAFGILRGEGYRDTREARHFFVTGTPGIGKTVFGFYMLYKLRMDPEFKDADIIWEDGSKLVPGTSFLFKGNDTMFGKVGDFDTSVTQHTIFLVNGPRPELRMRQNVGHVIMFSSTEDQTVSTWQFCKDTIKHTVYMPLWDLCELLLAAKMSDLSVSEDSVRDRFEKFGGSARSVLMQYRDTEYMKRFDSALKQATDKARFEYTVGSLLQAKESSSFILHLKVVDEDCMKTSVVFASHYVRMVLRKYDHLDNLASAVEYVNKFLLVPDEGIIVGKRFEFLVHKLFISSIIGTLKFKAKQLSLEIDQTEEVTFQLAGAKLQQFHTLDDINTVSNGYFVPDFKTYPVYDSLILLKDPSKDVTAQALQITINTYHPAKLQFVEELIERWKLERFYYVVPEGLFDKFPYQKLLHGKSEHKWPCELWKLAIPSHFFGFHMQETLGT